MDMLFIEKSKLSLFTSAIRVEVIKALQEEGFDIWDVVDEVIPYAICEDLVSKAVQVKDEGYLLAKCEYTYIIDQLTNWALAPLKE